MRNWCIVLLLMCCVSVGAQQIVERSAKKRPEWYGTTRQGFLVVTGVDSDLQKAQQKTLNEVKLQILQSVAQNVTYSNEMMTELLTQNQDVQTTTSFREQGTTRVANLPFLTGITLSRAADSYWELQRDKQSGEMQYAFCLLYPYSDADYQELKAQFDELEGRMEKVFPMPRRQKIISRMQKPSARLLISLLRLITTSSTEGAGRGQSKR